ncbi:hypothetical protein DL768_005029 [Monosporascus sp. mg162]|nr:hypothetical protein DL768_005029 [Monosporascus sp. mg162]
MTTITTSSPTQTLPGSWAPTAPGCLRSTDFWIWQYHPDSRSSDMRTVLGGPTQTTDCLAPTWQSDVVYAGTQCPPNYTPACKDEAVTCCPDVYEFTCAAPPGPSGHSEMFRCASRWSTEDATAVITLTDLRDNGIEVVTRPLLPHQHLFALAMVYTPTEHPPETATPPTNGDGDSCNGARAAAGIGVGVAAGVALIALATWVLWRRRRKHRQQTATPTISPSAPSAHSGTLGPGYFRPAELPTEQQYIELMDTTTPTVAEHDRAEPETVHSVEFLLAQNDARKLAEHKITAREDNYEIVDNVQAHKGYEQAPIDSGNTTVVLCPF